MALNKVDLCGVDTSKLPVLTSAEMKKLFEPSRRATKRRARSLSAATSGWCCRWCSALRAAAR